MKTCKVTMSVDDPTAWGTVAEMLGLQPGVVDAHIEHGRAALELGLDERLQVLYGCVLPVSALGRVRAPMDDVGELEKEVAALRGVIAAVAAVLEAAASALPPALAGVTPHLRALCSRRGRLAPPPATAPANLPLPSGVEAVGIPRTPSVDLPGRVLAQATELARTAGLHRPRPGELLKLVKQVAASLHADLDQQDLQDVAANLARELGGR